MAVRPLTIPTDTSVVLAAAQWVEGTILGSLAVTIAVIAVAWTGLMMLSGHMDLRKGVTVIAGCFLLFGAPTLAKGLRSVHDKQTDTLATYQPAPMPDVYSTPQILPPPPPLSSEPYDPYAGASVPQ